MEETRTDGADARPSAERTTVALLGGAAALAALAALAGPAAWEFFSDGGNVERWVNSWGPFAPAAMAALVAAQIVVAVLPGEPVELAAGYLFGFAEGTAICLLGGALGTLAVLALTKSMGARVARAFFSEQQLGRLSWIRESRRFELLMLVVFLIPGTPKDALTYVAGLSSCRGWRILAIATVGKIPSIATSTLAAGFASEGQWAAAAATAALTLASVAVGAAVYRRMADGKRVDRPPD